MNEFQGYNSFMATYINGDYPNLEYTPGLSIREVLRLSGDWVEDSCAWLAENAKGIDVLNLYHLVERSFRHAETYKKHNPSGKVYLKLDGCPLIGGRRPRAWMHPRALGKLLRMRRLFDCISTELPENVDKVAKTWSHKIIHVPNPLNPNEIRDYKPFSERRNVIITIGRLGTRQKATEILLEAFAKISTQIPEWKLKLAGPITDRSITDEFANKYPDLSERVIFTGEIRDREELIKLYRDSKIFAFPSRHESFGIALTEAMSHGCFAVTSDISSSRSLTENFRFGLGSKVDDIEGLAQNLLYACTHESEIEKLAIEGREATLKRCNIENVCKSIAEGLK
ncbi:MAG: glycosyltransferase family 4 protein [Synergistaceae bacterium]|nr:glycosyltransferase family 4 protein [Synergistaceae bacterium]